VNEEFDTRRCFPKDREWIISNRETLIELLGYSIKEWGVSRRRGIGVGSETNNAIAINRGSKGQGYRAVGLIKHSSHNVWKGGSHDERIIRGGWASPEGKQMTLDSWEPWGSFVDTTLA